VQYTTSHHTRTKHTTNNPFITIYGLLITTKTKNTLTTTRTQINNLPPLSDDNTISIINIIFSTPLEIITTNKTFISSLFIKSSTTKNTLLTITNYTKSKNKTQQANLEIWTTPEFLPSIPTCSGSSHYNNLSTLTNGRHTQPLPPITKRRHTTNFIV